MFIFHSKSGAGSDPRRGPITRSKSRSSASNESADPVITGGGAQGDTGSDPRRGPITRSKSRSSASNESADPLITGGGGAQFGGRKSKSSSEIR